MYSRTLTRKTSLLRKIEPIARRSSFANRIIYNLLHLAMKRAPNDLEIVMGRAIACTIQLGSISSLRCQKSRMSHPVKDNACEVMFRGRFCFGYRSADRALLMLSWRSDHLVEPDGIEPTTSCLQSTRSPS
jgi:hypothetical protein